MKIRIFSLSHLLKYYSYPRLLYSFVLISDNFSFRNSISSFFFPFYLNNIFNFPKLYNNQFITNTQINHKLNATFQVQLIRFPNFV